MQQANRLKRRLHRTIALGATLLLAACLDFGGVGNGDASGRQVSVSEGEANPPGTSQPGTTQPGTNPPPVVPPAANPSLAILAGAVGGFGSADGSGGNARFNLPYGIAADAAGNLYIADAFNNTIRKLDANGLVSTVAGAPGTMGSADGAGTAARFAFGTTAQIAAGLNGDLFVTDSLNQTVRRIDSNGNVSTIAGSPRQAGHADGAGAAARFHFDPSGGIAVDGDGVIYIADASNHVIRRILPGGIVSTIAGIPGVVGSNDGGAGVATFNYPQGVAVNNNGDVYVTDTGNHTIRRIDSNGNVITLAGQAGQPGAADGSGAAARFVSPVGITLDAAGDLYVTNTRDHTIRKVTQAGVVSTVAGTFARGGSADGSGVAAQFNFPSGITHDANGMVYVSDTQNNTIRRITPAGVVSTIAGQASPSGLVDGSGSAARFFLPWGLASDSAGNLYLTDSGANVVRKISPTGVVSTLAGGGSTGTQEGNVDGVGTAALFSSLNGLAVDGAGNVYVADGGNHSIRKITPAGVVTTFAGSTSGVSGSNDGVGTAARFFSPGGIAIDAAGVLYVTDSDNNTIRSITPSGVVSTLAGRAGNTGSADGTGSAASFHFPVGIVVDAAGNLFVTDALNSAIRKITPAGVVSTLAGSARELGTAGYSDGTGSGASFNVPMYLAIDGGGNLFVSDYVNQVIRKVTPAGVVSTVIGLGNSSNGASPGVLPARLNAPIGIATLPGGQLAVISEYAVLVTQDATF